MKKFVCIAIMCVILPAAAFAQFESSPGPRTGLFLQQETFFTFGSVNGGSYIKAGFSFALSDMFIIDAYYATDIAPLLFSDQLIGVNFWISPSLTYPAEGISLAYFALGLGYCLDISNLSTGHMAALSVVPMQIIATTESEGFSAKVRMCLVPVSFYYNIVTNAIGGSFSWFEMYLYF